MYLSKIVLKNFRQFSEDEPLEVEFQPGVVALAGPNDSGKTAIIDAIRYLLTTRDQEYSPYLVDDYYIDPEGKQTTKFTIDTVFDDLSEKDIVQYLEYLTYPLDSEGNRCPDAQHPTLHLRLQVEKKRKVPEHGMTPSYSAVSMETERSLTLTLVACLPAPIYARCVMLSGKCLRDAILDFHKF